MFEQVKSNRQFSRFREFLYYFSAYAAILHKHIGIGLYAITALSVGAQFLPMFAFVFTIRAFGILISDSGLERVLQFIAIDWFTEEYIIVLFGVFVIVLFTSASLLSYFSHKFKKNVGWRVSVAIRRKIYAQEDFNDKSSFKKYLMTEGHSSHNETLKLTASFQDLYQSSVVLLICLTLLFYLYPLATISFLFLFLMIMVVYAGRHATKNNILQSEMLSLKDSILNSKSRYIEDCGCYTRDSLKEGVFKIIGSNEEKRLDELKGREALESRKVQIYLYTVLGIILALFLWRIFYDVHALGGSVNIEMIAISAFLLRFIINVLHLFTYSFRRISSLYPAIKRIVSAEVSSSNLS